MITVNFVASLFHDYHKINYGKITGQKQVPSSKLFFHFNLNKFQHLLLFFWHHDENYM